MQLILTQADIELAISNFVNDTFVLKAGNVVQVTIDGDVTIDIVPEGTEPTAPAVKQTRAPRGSKAAKVTATKVEEPKADTVDEVKDTQPKVEEEVEQEEEVPDPKEANVKMQDEEPESPVDEEEEETPPPAVKPTSLFANLTKPKNT